MFDGIPRLYCNKGHAPQLQLTFNVGYPVTQIIHQPCGKHDFG
jgi:hypothetical protein